MSSETERLEGRVATIIDYKTLVINIGKEKGVKRGMKFAVLAETSLDIIDPDSHRILDSIDREKIRVEAVEVRDLVTVCKTYRTKKIPGGPLYHPDLADFARPPREIEETLSIEEDSLPSPLPEEDSYVKVNDRVLQTVDN